jgi:hypothetical protein
LPQLFSALGIDISHSLSEVYQLLVIASPSLPTALFLPRNKNQLTIKPLTMRFVQNYSLLLFKSTVMLVLVAFSFSSCKKDKENVPTPPTTIEGKWIGVLKASGYADSYLSFDIKASGIVEAWNDAGQKIGDGTWQMNGATFTANYSNYAPMPKKFSFIGTLENPTKLSGAWGTGNSQTNGGFWNTVKQLQ